MEGNARDVVGVTFERQDGIRVGGLDVVKLHRVMAGCSKVPFVGRDAESIDFGIGMGYRARTDAGQSFPETARRGLAVSSVKTFGDNEFLQDSHALTGWYGHSQLYRPSV